MDDMRKELHNSNDALEEKLTGKAKTPRRGLLDIVNERLAEQEKREYQELQEQERTEHLRYVNEQIEAHIPRREKRTQLPQDFRWYKLHGREIDFDTLHDTGKFRGTERADQQDREEWLKAHGYGPGEYPPPEHDPFNRLQFFFSRGSQPTRRKVPYYNRKYKKVIYHGQNYTEWGLFWKLWRNYGRSDKTFDWKGFREAYKRWTTTG